MVKKVLLFDNPNGYAFLFLSKIEIKKYEVFVISEYDNIYNSNWQGLEQIDKILFYRSGSIIRGIKLLNGNFIKKEYFKQFDEIITFTFTGLVFLTTRGFKPLYYNIGGYKDFYSSYKLESLGIKYFHKFCRSIVFKLMLFRTKSIIVSNQMDFEHVFNSFFSYKVRYLPIFVPKWQKYNPSYGHVINFVHFSAQSYRLKNNKAIFDSLEIMKKIGIKFKLHIFLWGIDVNKTLQIFESCNFKDDIVINERFQVDRLQEYIINLPRVFVLGEFSEFTGPGSGGAIREASSAGIPCISYVKNDGIDVEPTSMYLNSNALCLSENMIHFSKFSENQYFELCKNVFNEFNFYYSDLLTNSILKDILNEIL